MIAVWRERVDEWSDSTDLDIESKRKRKCVLYSIDGYSRCFRFVLRKNKFLFLTSRIEKIIKNQKTGVKKVYDLNKSEEKVYATRTTHFE